MRRFFRILLLAASSLLAVALLLFAVGCWLYLTSDYREPNIEIDQSSYTVTMQGNSCRVCGKNSVVRNDYGLWEVYLEGSPSDRGAAYGALCEDILKYQEKVFVDQIHELVPSERIRRHARVFAEHASADVRRHHCRHLAVSSRPDGYHPALSATSTR